VHLGYNAVDLLVDALLREFAADVDSPPDAFCVPSTSKFTR
jgi:hypothetical protein